MRKTFMYRIYPNRPEQKALQSVLDECRWVYNKTLEIRKAFWEQDQKSLSLYDTNKFITLWREERPTLVNAYSHTLQNAQERVDLAFQAYFRRVKVGEREVGYPRFKGYDRYDSFTFKESGFSLKGGRLRVSKVGSVKVVLHRPLEGIIKTLTIKRSSTGKWYASFSCEVEPKRLPKKDNPVGIDVGLHTFAALSDTNKIENPRFFRKEEKELAKVQRKLSVASKGTKERRFRRKAVARVHERISNKRDNFAHQGSRKIVDGYGIICVEDLKVNRMVHNHCLSKSISDAAWSGFFSMLLYKAEEAGRTFIKVNPAYTSQDCSVCGHRQKMPLSERTYHCPCCNLVIDRDLNAALNILRIGLDSLSNQPVEATALQGE
jgi:putative transposase